MVEVKSTNEGRQAERRPMALRVLLISTGLMVVALVGLMLWNYVDAPTSYPAESQSASRLEVTGSANGTGGGASPTNTSGMPAGNPAYPEPAVKNANQ